MGHGGARVGAGRPKKNGAKQDSAAPIKNKKIPPPVKAVYENTLEHYHAMAMKEAADVLPSADSIKNEVLTYVKAMNCEGYIPPNIIDDYVINRLGFLSCEAMNRRMGRMTKDVKLSPYVTAANTYYRAMQSDFQLIMQTIFKFGRQEEPKEENVFLRLLLERGF